MISLADKLAQLRITINENLRTQLDTEKVEYIGTANTMADAKTKQSHCIFARRGCGKTLLLHHSRRTLAEDARGIYINCEDFKHHTFPNVLIEILDATFGELEKNRFWWFGRKAQLKKILAELRKSLSELRAAPDALATDIRTLASNDNQLSKKDEANAGLSHGPATAGINATSERIFKSKTDLEKKYVLNENKLQQLNQNLPSYKKHINDFFEISGKLRTVLIQIDDFYHLNRTDQPFVADYVHRMCKDTPLKFKIATLKHNSVLYIVRAGQPIGIQEKHDYQPINIDFTFEQFGSTRKQNRGIFLEYAKLAGLTEAEFDALFKGKGFDRLILAGGGVPRDCLSFFLEVLDKVKTSDPAGKIGKDDVRFLSKETFERRIDELKQDSEGQDQEALLRGIFTLRAFCLEKRTNVFLIAEDEIQTDDDLKTLVYRLLDYRIVHKVANALTHKSKPGTSYQAFAIDIGCYAYMRNLQGRLTEIDLTDSDAKEKMRSSPILQSKEVWRIWKENENTPVETMLDEQERFLLTH